MISKHLKQTSSASFDMNPPPWWNPAPTYPEIQSVHSVCGGGSIIYCLVLLKQESWFACSVATCYFRSLLFGQLSDNSPNVESMWIIKLILLQQVAIFDRSNPNNQTHFVKRIIHLNGPIHILSTVIYPWFINNCSLKRKYLFRGIVTNLFWTITTFLIDS